MAETGGQPPDPRGIFAKKKGVVETYGLPFGRCGGAPNA